MSTKIGALVIDLQGFQLSPEERELLNHPLVGGVILFSRNYDNLSQLQELCRSVRAARQLPLLIMADQEGGRVQRFRSQFFALPSLSFLGEWHDKNPTLAVELARTSGWLMAHEVLNAGLDFSLAPVVDLNKGISSVIGNRALHSDAAVVSRLAHFYIQGMLEAGMTATIKHFPGHGSVQTDSHLDITIDERELQVILEDDIKPFTQLVRDGVRAVMAAHIKFPNVDAAQVSFSRVWLQEILRERLGFNGVVLSDDLNMQGANISADYADRVLAAREAGCDYALVCNNRAGVIQVIDRVPHCQHQLTEEKWQCMQGDFSLLKNIAARHTLAKQFIETHMAALTDSTCGKAV